MFASNTDSAESALDPANFPIGGSPVLTPPTPGGLTLGQLEDMLSDIRFQPKWREAADQAADYYDGHQIEAERLQRMQKLGIPPLVTNLIRPTIDSVLGLEAKTRTDWRVVEEDSNAPVPEQILNAMNQKLSEAERETRADRAISDAHASQIKSGLGWVEVGRSTDATAYPYRVSTIHRGEIWWDWRAKNPDLTDARYMVRKRRFDQDELIALMPEHAELIKKAVAGGFRTWQWETRDLYSPTLAYAAEVERLTNLDESEWRDAERKRATLFEVWYRKWCRGLVLRLPNGKVVPFNPQNPRHVMAVQAGIIKPYEATYSEMRVAFYLGPHQLYDFKSPHSHRFFPYVPFWGFREDKSGIPYGLIRGMMSPQDVVNSADAKMHWLLNARRLVANSDSIDTKHNSWRQVQDELSRPDAVVLLDPSKPNSKFDVSQDFALNAQQYQRRVQAANDIENAGGIFKSMMGKDGGATSGIAINALIEQGSVTLAEINDNYRFSRRQVGEMLFSMVQDDLIGQTTTVHTTRPGSRVRQPVVLNQPREDGGLDNNTALVNAKVVLSDVPSTPAFRAQQLQILSEVVKSLPEQMQMATVDVMFKLTDVPEKEVIVERLRRIAGIQDVPPEQEDQMQAAQAAEAAAAADLMKRQQESNIVLNSAKADKLDAETEKTLIEAEVLEMQLRGLAEGAAQSNDPEAAALYEEIQGNLAEIEQLRAALQDKMVVHQDNMALKKYALDQKHDIDKTRAESEHAARITEAAQGWLAASHTPITGGK